VQKLERHFTCGFLTKIKQNNLKLLFLFHTTTTERHNSTVSCPTGPEFRSHTGDRVDLSFLAVLLSFWRQMRGAFRPRQLPSISPNSLFTNQSWGV